MITQTAVDLIDMGNHALQQGQVALARGMYEESLIIWRALDDAPGMGHALERLRTLEGNARSTKWAEARGGPTGTRRTWSRPTGNDPGGD